MFKDSHLEQAYEDAQRGGDDPGEWEAYMEWQDQMADAKRDAEMDAEEFNEEEYQSPEWEME